MPLITAFHFNSRTTFPYYLLTNLRIKLLCIAIAGMNLSVEPPMEVHHALCHFGKGPQINPLEYEIQVALANLLSSK